MELYLYSFSGSSYPVLYSHETADSMRHETRGVEVRNKDRVYNSLLLSEEILLLDLMLDSFV